MGLPLWRFITTDKENAEESEGIAVPFLSPLPPPFHHSCHAIALQGLTPSPLTLAYRDINVRCG